MNKILMLVVVILSVVVGFVGGLAITPDTHVYVHTTCTECVSGPQSTACLFPAHLEAFGKSPAGGLW